MRMSIGKTRLAKGEQKEVRKEKEGETTREDQRTSQINANLYLITPAATEEA